MVSAHTSCMLGRQQICEKGNSVRSVVLLSVAKALVNVTKCCNRHMLLLYARYSRLSACPQTLHTVQCGMPLKWIHGITCSWS